MQTKLKSIELEVIDEIFDMKSGYVLDFTNRTFEEFFSDELNIEIYHDKYDADGSSKAKRLRCLLKVATDQERVKILISLWKYRTRLVKRNKLPEIDIHLIEDFSSLLQRIGGELPELKKAPPTNGCKIDPKICEHLLNRLVSLSELSPIQRGFAFEKFLFDLFNAYGLSAKSSFRVVGEQIDGSFEIHSNIYLLEAKWTNKPVDAATLRAFNAKVEEKAFWSRGLFISDCGFSTDGLIAFGKGKRVICMDGLDLSDMLQNNIHLSEVIAKKSRYAAETGMPFVRNRDL